MCKTYYLFIYNTCQKNIEKYGFGCDRQWEADFIGIIKKSVNKKNKKMLSHYSQVKAKVLLLLKKIVQDKLSNKVRV